MNSEEKQRSDGEGETRGFDGDETPSNSVTQAGSEAASGTANGGKESATYEDMATRTIPKSMPTGSAAVDTSKARLIIVEEPRQRGFRFRYSCEGPSHGGLPGDTSEKNRKSYPTVKLEGYEGEAARVVVSLVTQDDPPRPHAHSLVGRHVVNGQCTVQIGSQTNWMASFPNLGILHVTKKNVVKVLLERYALALTGPGASGNALPIMEDLRPGAALSQAQTDEAAVIAASMNKLSDDVRSNLQSMAEETSRHMNLSVVRLCFQAYVADSDGAFTMPLQPCISQPVFDSKAPSASTLKICRMDRHSGSVLGGDEVYLLCDRVQKDDIEVRFFAESEGSGDDGGSKGEAWSAIGMFAPSDVHRQSAIVFKTPPYFDTSISRPVSVWIQLRRRSDNDTSDAKPFTYQPQVVDTEQLARKRMKKIPHFFDHYGETGSNSRSNGNGNSGGGGPGGGGGSGGGGAAGGGSGDPMWGSTGGPGGNQAAGGVGATGGFVTGFGFNSLPPLSGRQATTAPPGLDKLDEIRGDLQVGTGSVDFVMHIESAGDNDRDDLVRPKDGGRIVRRNTKRRRDMVTSKASERFTSAGSPELRHRVLSKSIYADVKKMRIQGLSVPSRKLSKNKAVSPAQHRRQNKRTKCIVRADLSSKKIVLQHAKRRRLRHAKRQRLRHALAIAPQWQSSGSLQVSC